jgi:hypothetical protein
VKFLDNLKSVFHIDIPNLKSIHFFSDNKNTQAGTTVNNTYNINIGSINSADIPKVMAAIKNSVKEEDALIIESDASQLLNDIVEVEKKEENTELLDFFRGKISNSDLEILRASLYVKDVFDRGDQRRQVAKLKEDIMLRYGYRGRNIVNLCTARYFTTLIKPLYLEMLNQPNFTPELFLDTFKTIVSQFPFAIFVNSRMTKEQLNAEFIAKMKRNKQYGIKKLNIHAIGDGNVAKIDYVLEKNKHVFTSRPETESGRGYMIITIYF